MKKLLALSALAAFLSTAANAGLLEDVKAATKDKVASEAIKAAVDVKLYEAVVCIEKKDGKLIRTHSDSKLNGEIPASDTKGIEIANSYFTDEDGKVTYEYEGRKFSATVVKIDANNVCAVRAAAPVA